MPRMTFREALLTGGVVAGCAFSGAAWAQPFQGFYVNLGGGYNWRDEIDTKTSFPGSPPGIRLKVQDANGFVGLGSVGYGFGNGLRLEVEGDYRQSDVRRVTGTPFPAVAGGEIRNYGGMFNALYDLDIGFPWLFPYLGAGAGYAERDLNNASLNRIGGALPLVDLNGSAGSFAFQAIAGLSFPVPYVPGLSITTEYRFYGLFSDPSYHGTITTAAAGGRLAVSPASLTLRNSYNHAALLGVRYAFGVAPPPPPPAPVAPVQVPPTRSYLVFFDWDKATLTDRARQIIREAADASTHVQYTRIEVNGYTDTSGTPQYNQGLSVRRAEAVAAELVRDGVPRNAITIQGFGETHLLVPTGPGVREPQNRRVEIIIR